MDVDLDKSWEKLTQNISDKFGMDADLEDHPFPYRNSGIWQNTRETGQGSKNGNDAHRDMLIT